MAVASLGLDAVAITCGEKTSGLSPEALSRIRQLAGHRPVAIPHDNDSKGRQYASATARQVADGGLDARDVDLQLTEEGADVTDWLVEQRVHKGLDAATVAAQLQNAFDRSLAPTSVPQSDENSADFPGRTAADSSVAPDGGDRAGGRHRDSQQVTKTVDVPIRSIGDVWASQDTWKPKERISTHIKSLDQVLGGGFTTAGLHMAVGKPGSCKTQLALQILLNVARWETPVGFVSLEMEAAEVGRLALCQLAGVPRSAVERGLTRLSDRAAAKSVKKAISKFHAMPLHVVDGEAYDYACDREQLDRLVEAGVQHHDWRFVVLDHLGELAPTDTDKTRETVQVERSNIAALRAIAKRHNVALLVVAQMRKAATYKDVKKAKFTLDDVLGAAEIGYKLDTCIGVVKKYARPPRCSRILLSLLKTRWSAPIDVPVHLKWLPSSGRVRDFPEPSNESAMVDTAVTDEEGN